MGGGRKRVVTAVTAATVVTAVTADFLYICRNASHPVPPYDTYHITLSDFALRPPMSGYNGWESTHKHEHSSLYYINTSDDLHWMTIYKSEELSPQRVILPTTCYNKLLN